jgi:hypothetical protein
MKKYTQIIESNNIDYYSKLMTALTEVQNFKEKILEYISYKENYNPPGFFIESINIVEGEIRVLTDSDNNSYMSWFIGNNKSSFNKDDFNRFLNDPEVYKNSKKYNL